MLAQHCTRTERRSEAAERELIRVKLLSYLEDQVGKAFHAIIVGVEDFGLFCRLSELPVEGLIHVTSLADDYYYLESGTHTLVGRRSGRRHRLGDRESCGSPTSMSTGASWILYWPRRPCLKPGFGPSPLRARALLGIGGRHPSSAVTSEDSIRIADESRRIPRNRAATTEVTQG